MGGDVAAPARLVPHPSQNRATSRFFLPHDRHEMLMAVKAELPF
jgi:hypothetical protein